MSIGDDDINIDDVANDIVDNTLDTLSNQTDDQGTGELYETIRINPQAFNVKDSSTPSTFVENVIQHVSFKTPFDTLPVITFGQASAGESTPFVVHPYVHKWTYTNGLVDGFDMGIYSITRPEGTVSNHYISWRAIGPQSRAGQQGVEQSWQDPYGGSEPDFLVSDTEDTADAGEDLLSEPYDSGNYPY